MRGTRRFLGYALFGIALVMAVGCLCDEETALREKLDACNKSLEDQGKRLSDCQTELKNCCGKPPSGPIIVIDPGGGGNAFAIGSSTAQASTSLSGVQLNHRAFGVIDKFKGLVMIGGQQYDRDIASLSATFGSKTLTIERSNTTPEVFVWKLDGVAMTPVTGLPEADWNPDLCVAISGSVNVVAKKPGGGTENATGVRVELRAN